MIQVLLGAHFSAKFQGGDVKLNTKSKHFVAEFWGVKPEKLNDIKKIQQDMEFAVKKAKGTILNSFGHKFSPQGVSVVITISESHLSIHTFPEKGYCAMDIYTCGKTLPDKAIEYLKEQFSPKKANVIEIIRGTKKGIEVFEGEY